MNPVDWRLLPVEPTGVSGGTEPDVAPGKPALGIAINVVLLSGDYRSFGREVPELTNSPFSPGGNDIGLLASPLGFTTGIRTALVLPVKLSDLGA